jgi:hypothetical protein
MKKTKEELNDVLAQLNETTLKWMEVEVALRAQETENVITRKFVPDDMLDALAMELPSRQPVWEP